MKKYLDHKYQGLATVFLILLAASDCTAQTSREAGFTGTDQNTGDFSPQVRPDNSFRDSRKGTGLSPQDSRNSTGIRTESPRGRFDSDAPARRDSVLETVPQRAPTGSPSKMNDSQDSEGTRNGVGELDKTGSPRF